jgi:hypothetical protein
LSDNDDDDDDDDDMCDESSPKNVQPPRDDDDRLFELSSSLPMGRLDGLITLLSLSLFLWGIGSSDAAACMQRRGAGGGSVGGS